MFLRLDASSTGETNAEGKGEEGTGLGDVDYEDVEAVGLMGT